MNSARCLEFFRRLGREFCVVMEGKRTAEFSLLLSCLNCSKCRRAPFCDGESSVNLGASRCHPTMLLCVAERFSKNLSAASGWIFSASSARNSSLLPAWFSSPQRAEDYGPQVEDVLRSRLITEGGTIYESDILDTYLGFGIGGGPKWIYAQGRCSSSRTSA